MTALRDVVQQALDAALDATGATSGWVVRLDGEGAVVEAAGGAAAGSVGRRLTTDAAAAVTAATGQPMARRVAPDDPAARGAAGLAGTPRVLLSVPCGSSGAFELADRLDGEAFSLDDVEVVSLLAQVAGVALDRLTEEAPPPSPEVLAARLAALARRDPEGYARAARTIEHLLGEEP